MTKGHDQKDEDNLGADAAPSTEPGKFDAVVDAMNVGDKCSALKFLRAMEQLTRADIELLCDLIDDEKSYAAIHPYRLDLVSRLGAGSPPLPYFTRVEDDWSVRLAVKSLVAEGMNLKSAQHAVAQQRQVSTSTVQKAYQRAGQFTAKKSLFKTTKSTK